ncbi:hypothetical protein M8Z33_07665 [Streptomyces sp. ZAF1911]|uniref:hypothetical protein n=1 Tax=Streptomyces sp. ZAF1911 TaxID=2944129 RepID=UPI00237A9C55|nr:hypothetical protein [Streptomyces sp. ZAF1911]MDD9376552.1 hypothetical protein [Streptomyces sp. ZAF1911]
MHPTRTTTKLLLGVACAVSAVSGCVNVTPPPVQPARPGTPGAPPRHEPAAGRGPRRWSSGHPPWRRWRPWALPGRPARGALHPAGPPSARPGPRRGGGRERAARSRGAPAAAAPVPDIPEPRQHGGHRDHADGRPGGQYPGRPRSEGAEVPRELVRELPVRPADVCALGRRHGRWHPDSPEARICAGVQGG